MHILLPRAYGMCFGVRDALALADSIADPSSVTIYGELAHNEEVRRRLAERGFRGLEENARDGAPPTARVLLTPHGVSDRERARLTGAGASLIDATCPLVRAAHAAALRFAAEGRFVVVVGRADHVEVRGLVGDLPRHAVVAGPDDVETYPAASIGVVAQTTTTAAELAAALEAVRERNPAADVRLADTICQPTRDRQAALAALLPQIEVLVVVGGRGSRNTRQLADAAARAGVRAHHVQRASDLDPAWFAGAPRVGLTAGTSTPAAILAEVYDALVAMEPPRE